ncbi:MAG: hypothetical protein M3Y85_08065 [Bacteroidota bacterium]|nr:hypothetical protein [Bacteroidota bacterium]
MNEDFQEQQERRYAKMRSINDYTRGAIFILFGLFFLLFKRLNIQGLEYKDWYVYIGGLFVIYGIWRMYRGYKKNYFR